MSNSVGVVYKKGIAAAQLAQVPGGLQFEYLPDYLVAGLPPVATTLPLSAQPLTLPSGASPAFFAGLLPEGRRLNATVTKQKIAADDDLGLLLALGADLIGDVQVFAQGTGPADAPARDLLMLPQASSGLIFDDLRDQYFGSRASAIPGVQDKVSSKMLNARARTANQEFIIKFNPQDAKFAVENEHLFLRLAKQAGLQTAKFELLTDSVGNRALKLWRFDRALLPGGVAMLAAEDGCQAMNKYPAEKYSIDLVEMAQTLISHCAAKPVAAMQLFKQIVFSWLIGNGDAHAKNFSILENAVGEFQVSPAYDLLCTRYYDDRTMALAINGNDTDWSAKLLLEVAEQLGLPQKAAQVVIAKQLSALRNLPDLLLSGALPFRRDQNIEVAEFIKRRAKKLAG